MEQNKAADMEQNKAAEKKWVKPQLIVLTKSRPEEAVLDVCKFVVLGGPNHTPCATGTGMCRSALNS